MSPARLALACYPPSWKERYGEELAELARPGDTLDLLVGAVRAWMHPVGQRTQHARRLSAISTVHVSWCVGYVAAIGFLKAVDDPPVPGLTTGASQPLWAIAKATFFVGWLVFVVTGTALLLRIGVPAVRRREWHVLRPMLPAAQLLVVVVATIPILSAFDGTAQLVATGGWLALGLGLVTAGAAGPVTTLRRAALPPQALRLPLLGAGIVTAAAVCMAAATTGQAAVLSGGLTPYNLALLWGSVAVLVMVAGTSTVSVRRALDSRQGTMVGDDPRRPAA